MNVRLGERFGSVGRIWQSCWPVGADSAVATWLQAQRISLPAVTRRDLARALAQGALRSSGHRLVLPIYDPWGELTALAGHRVGGTTEPQMLLLGARQADGLVFANPCARRVLAGVARDRWRWRTVILTAGLGDYLQWAAAVAASDEGPAVIGLVESGSAVWAGRIPDGCRVIVRGDTSREVAAMAPRIVELLGARCEVIVRAGV